MKSADGATLGFRAHSGWAAVVALGGPPRSPEVIDRRRIELLERGSPGGMQPYHAARMLDLARAEKFIESAITATDRAALLAVRAVQEVVRGLGRQVISCGIVLASGRPLPALEVTLRSHPMLHTAEGVLFRGALERAAKKCGWPCVRIRERELYDAAAKQLRIPEAKLKTRVTEMGRAVGTPWSADEKCATLVAWLALVNSQNAKKEQ